MSLPFVFETDAGNTDSLLQPPGDPAAPGYKYPLEPAASSPDPSLAQDVVEVLLLRLKPDTQYTATVYPRAFNGAEGQPQAVEFKTSTWSFVKWLQPEFPSAKFVLRDLLLQRSFCGWREFSGRDFGQIRSSEFLPSSMAQALLFPDAHPRVLSSYYVWMRGAPLFFLFSSAHGPGRHTCIGFSLEN